MKTRAGIFVLIVTGILLALILAEILVRLILPQDRLVTWIEMHPTGFMMNQSGVEAMHQFRDREVTYRLNTQRLRGHGFPTQNEKKVLILGDSFTFGLLLDEQDTYVSLIQEKINDRFGEDIIRLLNGGVGGAGLADWPGWLEHKEDEMSPDLIIYYMHNQDADRALSKNLFVVAEEDSSLVSSMRWQPREWMFTMGRQSWYRWLQKHSDVMNIMVKLAWTHLYFKDLTSGFNPEKTRTAIPEYNNFSPESGYSLQLSTLLLKRLYDWCRKTGCELVITTTGFFNHDGVGPHTEPFYNYLSEGHFTSPFFDNTECVHTHAEGDLESIQIPDDSHPDERGAAIIAACSWEWLEPYLEHHIHNP